MKTKNPKIVITSGDPAGIGLDLCIKLAYKRFPANITIIANKEALKNRAQLYKKLLKLKKLSSTHIGNGSLKIINVPYNNKVIAGKINTENSLSQLEALKKITIQCINHKYDALVTLPINKKALSTHKNKFKGHTEFISSICKTKNKEVMLLTDGKLRVALATTHEPLSNVSKLITKNKLVNHLKTISNDLQKKFKIKNPKITVTGLNPHAGEEGQFGQEEIKIIIPAIKKLQDLGINVIGPVPADTAFTPTYIKNTDCFFAMYHDQGLGPFKALTFGKGVNVTLGLPIIRTSVDHGTALDIVGSKKIESASFFEAISLAIKLANNNDAC